MRRINLNARIQRLERKERIRRRWEPIYEAIARRRQEGRRRLGDWSRRREGEIEDAA